jgi:hypothetical protein
VADVEDHLGGVLELEENLRQAGATPAVALQIQEAIATLRADPRLPLRPAGPAPSHGSPKKSAVVAKKERKFGCFLSHHTGSCAMEGSIANAACRGTKHHLHVTPV